MNESDPGARAAIVKLGPPGEPPRRRRRLRTVATLPTLLTLGNLVCGIAAIHYCMSAIVDAEAGRALFEKATLHSQRVERYFPSFISISALMILLGMLLDMVDGRVARFTSRTSNFGGQLDSLADMVTFGVAPAVLTITLLTRLPEADLMALPARAIWVVGAIYASCAAMRLARFNVEHADGAGEHRNFHGLPSPGAAAVVSALVILHQFALHTHQRVQGSLWLANLLPYFTMACALLMVSNIRYVHIGNTYLRGRRPFEQVVIFLIVLGVFLWHPVPVLAAFVCAYAASGPVLAIVQRARFAGRHTASEQTEQSGGNAAVGSADGKTG